MDNKLTMGFTPEQLKEELFSVADAAMNDGRTYAPQNAWAIALFQAGMMLETDHADRAVTMDCIRKCAEQFKALEGKYPWEENGQAKFYREI